MLRRIALGVLAAAAAAAIAAAVEPAAAAPDRSDVNTVTVEGSSPALNPLPVVPMKAVVMMVHGDEPCSPRVIMIPAGTEL